LRAEGFEVTPVVVDVSERAPMGAFARTRGVARRGPLGGSTPPGSLPSRCPCKPLAVDPVGVALLAEEFGQVVAGEGPAL